MGGYEKPIAVASIFSPSEKDISSPSSLNSNLPSRRFRPNRLLQNKDRLQCIVLPGEGFVTAELSCWYERIYQFWKHQWQTTFSALKEGAVLNSDAFMRQTELIGIAVGEEVVGLICLQAFDFTMAAHRDHSYFCQFPKDVITDSLSRGIGKVCVLNQVSVGRRWRGAFGVAEVLGGLSVKCFDQSLFSHGICCTRNHFRVHDICYRWGGVALRQGHIIHGEPADIILFDKQSYSRAREHRLYDLVNTLWHKRIYMDWSSQGATQSLSHIRTPRLQYENNF
jgi:hypothetical protein